MKCPICGKEFFAVYPQKKYCSSECATKVSRAKDLERYRKRAQALPPKSPIKCVVCGKEFVPRNKKIVCCSQECSYTKNREYQRLYAREHLLKDAPKRKVYPKKVEKKKTNTLAEIAREAREHGMSYGKWIQQCEQK